MGETTVVIAVLFFSLIGYGLAADLLDPFGE